MSLIVRCIYFRSVKYIEHKVSITKCDSKVSGVNKKELPDEGQLKETTFT